MNLMESAGFSRSNPYYIVKLGNVSELATATDAARLKLLRDIVGSAVYESKKKDGLKLLQDTEEKLERVGFLLDSINQRLETLESEKEELKAMKSVINSDGKYIFFFS